jgi:starch-binding outer membrane protein, SusD/RagB family
MKRNQSIALLGLLLATGVAACSDLLKEDPEGFTTTDTFFKTGADLNSATLAIYNSLRGLQGTNNWTTPELASDQARADIREPNAGTYGPDRLDWSATTGRTGSFWTTGYAMITRANLVLANGPGIATLNAQTKAYNLAEAKFMRGYAYFILTRAYDDVPLLLSPEEQANPRPSCTPVEQVHQAIIADLTAAVAELPATWPTSDGYGNLTQGRVTKWAAEMALADLYLWRSSFMGTNQWTQASTRAKAVIDSGGSLNDDYLKTFLPSNKGNREMIFVITNSGVDARTSNTFQLFYYPRDWGIDAGQGGGWGLIHPTDWFFNSYRPGDYRRAADTAYTSTAAYVWGGCSFSGVCPTYKDTIGGVEVVRHDTLADGPMSWKYRKSDHGATWWLGDVDVPLYRYAEAILIYAEAQNELGNAGEAISYLNLIRARARKGTGAENRPEPAAYPSASDTLGLREAIFMERAWELAFEGKRWWDLVRRDSEDPDYWMTSLRNHDPNAEKKWPLDNNKKRFPIPDGQIRANPALRSCQNPGY